MRCAALIVVLASALVGMPGAGSAATTGQVVVGMTIADDIVLSMAGCPSEAANVTSFGTVMPGTPLVTSADCSITYGSTWNTAMLKAYQRDRGGYAMLAAPTANEVARWPLNGTGENVGKNDTTNQYAVPGTVPNDPAYVASKTGYGQGFDFDGNDEARINDNIGLHPANTITVDLWFNTTSVTLGGSCPTLISHTAGWNGNAFGILFNASTNELMGTAGVMNSWPNMEIATRASAAGLTDGQWHHVAFTVDWTAAPDVGRLYVDGVLKSTVVNNAAQFSYNGNPFMLGNASSALCGGGANNYYTGAIDEVRMSGVVRTAAEISSFYSGRVPDYQATTNNWAGTGDLFAGCLRSVSGVGVTGGAWGVDGNNDCTAIDSDPWRPFASLPTDPGTKVSASTTAGTVNAVANLRLGVRASGALPSGTYQAPLVFEVSSPDV